MTIYNVPGTYKMDTGGQANKILRNVFNTLQIYQNYLRSGNVMLITYNCDAMKPEKLTFEAAFVKWNMNFLFTLLTREVLPSYRNKYMLAWDLYNTY